MTPQRRHDLGIPGAYGILILDVISRWGIPEHALLQQCHLTRAQLANPSYRMSLSTANAMLQHALLLTERDSLAYECGMQMRISTHGFLGFAIMTASNGLEALQLLARYIGLRIPYGHIYIDLQPETSYIRPVIDLELEPLRREMVLSLSVGMLQIGRALINEDISAEIHLDFAKPKDFITNHNPLSWRFYFDQPHVYSAFPSMFLAKPLVNSDPVASQLALEQCEQELSQLGSQSRYAVKVRNILLTHGLGFPNIETVAHQLHVSDRTLKRLLAAEQTTFTEILDDVRYRQAISLLSRNDWSIERISSLLGYSDVTNFNRAFRRWTGKTPSRWRRESEPSSAT